MKFKYKMIAISLIAVLIIIFFKNSYIEYSLKDKCSKQNIQFEMVNCKGFAKITCSLTNIYSKQYNSSLSYTFLIEKLYLKNIFSIYKFFDLKNDNTIFNIQAYGVSLKDNKNVLKNSLTKINLKLTSNQNKIIFEFLKKNNIIFEFFLNKSHKEKIILKFNIRNKFIQKLFYDMYKLEYLKTKEEDGLAFAKGINLSLGIYSDTIIDEKDFLKTSLPIVSDLIISELESYDFFYENNQNLQISNLLNRILNEEGQMEFPLSINYKGLKND